MMLPETPHQEANAECQPLMELEPDANAQVDGGSCQMQSVACQMQLEL